MICLRMRAIASHIWRTLHRLEVHASDQAAGGRIVREEARAVVLLCDEAVPLALGGTEPRYTCNGTFDVSTKRGEVLQNLLTSCAGRLSYSGGQFVIQPAGWVDPVSTISMSGLTVGSTSANMVVAVPHAARPHELLGDHAV
jgi:hypothetical protein